MRWKALARDIGEGMRSQPARVGLAFASVAIGMAALTLLLAVIGGLRQRARAMVGELGVNVFGIVQTAPAGSSRTPVVPLTRRHADLLAASLPGAAVTGMRLYDGGPAGLPADAVIIATDATFFRVRPWRLASGRILDAEDIHTRAPCAVLTATLAQTLGIHPGDDVRLGRIPFRVVGIGELEAGAMEAGAGRRALAPGDRLLIVPWNIPPYWLAEGAPPDPRLDAVFVKGDTPERFDALLRGAENLLGDPAGAPTPLSWITPRGLVHRLLRFQRLTALAGGTVVLLCLVLGGITLTSLLLASLQTRIPEIGLRRALGASPAEIGVLFTGEALAVTLAATLAGMGLAGGLIAIARPWSPVTLNAGAAAFFIPPLSGLILGIAFSYWPARAAARIAPSEALRNE